MLVVKRLRRGRGFLAPVSALVVCAVCTSVAWGREEEPTDAFRMRDMRYAGCARLDGYARQHAECVEKAVDATDDVNCRSIRLQPYVEDFKKKAQKWGGEDYPYCDGKPLVHFLKIAALQGALFVEKSYDKDGVQGASEEVKQYPSGLVTPPKVDQLAKTGFLPELLRLKGVLCVDRGKPGSANTDLIGAIELLQDPNNPLIIP